MMRPLLVVTLSVLSGFGACSAVFCTMAARAQSIVGMPAPSPRGHVSYIAELAEVAAGKPSVIELRFRVDDGFHVNSHKPLSELLIPTALTLSGPAAKVVGEDYPKGAAFHLTVGEGEVLDVYQGEFRVKLTVVAPKGESLLMGSLRYQACDSRACYPPRTLPVSIALRGK